MTWSDISKIVLGIIASVGGVGVIIIGIAKFLANMISDRMLQKTEFKFSKELEDFKNHLDKKSYISKTRFDAEFNIYQKLSGATLQMVADTYWLFPIIDTMTDSMEKNREIFLQRNNTALESYNKALRIIRENAPFISEDIYNIFQSICNQCRTQVNNYHWFFIDADWKLNRTDDLQDEYKAGYKRTHEISEQSDEIIKRLREYLESLDVIEYKN